MTRCPLGLLHHPPLSTMLSSLWQCVEKPNQHGWPVLFSSLWAFAQFPLHGYKQHFILQMSESFGFHVLQPLTNRRCWYHDNREAKAHTGLSFWLQTSVFSFILEIKIVRALLATSSGVTSLSQRAGCENTGLDNASDLGRGGKLRVQVFNHSCWMSVLWNRTQNHFWDQ